MLGAESHSFWSTQTLVFLEFRKILLHEKSIGTHLLCRHDNFLSFWFDFLRAWLSRSLTQLVLFFLNFKVSVFDSVRVDEETVELKTAHLVDIPFLILLSLINIDLFLLFGEFFPFLRDLFAHLGSCLSFDLMLLQKAHKCSFGLLWHYNVFWEVFETHHKFSWPRSLIWAREIGKVSTFIKLWLLFLVANLIILSFLFVLLFLISWEFVPFLPSLLNQILALTNACSSRIGLH